MYNEFLETLNTRWNEFMATATNATVNKSAALRARKASIQLRKDLKEFRNVSIANAANIPTRRRGAASAAPTAETTGQESV